MSCLQQSNQPAQAVRSPQTLPPEWPLAGRRDQSKTRTCCWLAGCCRECSAHSANARREKKTPHKTQFFIPVQSFFCWMITMMGISVSSAYPTKDSCGFGNENIVCFLEMKVSYTSALSTHEVRTDLIHGHLCEPVELHHPAIKVREVHVMNDTIWVRELLPQQWTHTAEDTNITLGTLKNTDWEKIEKSSASFWPHD